MLMCVLIKNMYMNKTRRFIVLQIVRYLCLYRCNFMSHVTSIYIMYYIQ